MVQKSTSSKSESLVSEQPGFFLTILGVVIACALGFSVRNLIAPEKIKARVMSAAERLGSQYKINVDLAYFSLSRGLLPDFAIVVKNIDIESADLCSMSPEIHINELRFPLVLTDLLNHKNFLHAIEADTVLLLLRSEWKDCTHSQALDTSKAAPLERMPSSSQVNAAATEKVQQTSQPDIREFSVKKMKVNYLPIPFTSFELSDLSLQLKSEKPRQFQVKSKLDLGGETLSGDFSSQAHFELSVDETKSPQWESAVIGHWREGHYEMKLNFDPPSRQIEAQTSFKHLPLSQVFPLLKKYKVMSSDLNGKQTWFSGHLQMKGNVEQLDKMPVEVSEVKLEGDMGEIQLSQAQLIGFPPQHFSPISFELKDVNLDEMMKILNRSHPGPALGHLGYFSGKAQFYENQKVSINGQHKNFEMIFSNRGSRLVQAISQFMIDMELDQGQWSGMIKQIEIKDGHCEGDLKLRADRDWKRVEIQSRLKNMSLSPPIEELMTGGGKILPLETDLRMELVLGELKSLGGYIKSEGFEIDKVKIKNPKLNFASENENINVKVNAGQFEISEDSQVADLLKSFDKEKIFSQWPLFISDWQGVFKTDKLKSFSWSEVKGKWGSARFHSQGGWKENSELYGLLSIQDKGKKYQWDISGNRGQPQLLKK